MAWDFREEDKKVISGPKSLSDGIVYVTPGFCTRLTDFACYDWSPDIDYGEDIELWDDDLGGGNLDSLPMDGTGNFDGSHGFVDNFNPFDSPGFGWNGNYPIVCFFSFLLCKITSSLPYYKFSWASDAIFFHFYFTSTNFLRPICNNFLRQLIS